MNRLEITGRLTRDPEVKETTNSKVVKLSIASPVVDGKDVGVLFADVSAWPPIADRLEQYRKGDAVYVMAEGKTRKYNGKDGKEKHWTDWWVLFIQGSPSGQAQSVRTTKAKPADAAQSEPSIAIDSPGSDDVPF